MILLGKNKLNKMKSKKSLDDIGLIEIKKSSPAEMKFYRELAQSEIEEYKSNKEKLKLNDQIKFKQERKSSYEPFFEILLSFFSPFQYFVPSNKESEKEVKEKYKERIRKMQSRYMPVNK
jgi:hypothetical protein